MSKTAGFFNEYLPNKIEKNPDLATSVNSMSDGDFYSSEQSTTMAADTEVNVQVEASCAPTARCLPLR